MLFMLLKQANPVAICKVKPPQSKRQMIHTFTPSNQNVTIGSGGDANETFTGRVERNH